MNRGKNIFEIAILCIVSTLLLIASGCGKPHSSDGNDCKGLVCDKSFVSVSLNLKYPDGQPVLLDSSKVFWVSQNRYMEKYSFSRIYEANPWGNYLIVSDLMREELRNLKEQMRFTGYLNDEIVCERDVLVGADCCHVVYYGTEPLTVVIF